MYGASLVSSSHERSTSLFHFAGVHSVTTSYQCRHLALIGDHKQLPPIVISDVARDGGFDISLFERLTEEGGTYNQAYFHQC